MLIQQAPVTFTSMEYVHGTDSLKASVRLNYELFLRDYQQTVFDDLGIEDMRSFDPFPADLANNYLNSKISVHDGKRQVTGKLLKMEKEGEDIRFCLLYRVDSRLKSITVQNTILTGLYSKVENLTFVKSRKKESWIKFTSAHTEETFIMK